MSDVISTVDFVPPQPQARKRNCNRLQTNLRRRWIALDVINCFTDKTSQFAQLQLTYSSFDFTMAPKIFL